jgi:hypothetical protein
MKFLYLRFNDCAMAVSTEDNTNINDNVIKVNKAYQLLYLPTAYITQKTEDQGFETVMLERFNSENKECFKPDASVGDGTFFINVRECIEISGMKSFPNHRIISEEELQRIEDASKIAKMLLEDSKNGKL